MEEAIKNLNERIAVAATNLKNLEKAKEALQNICAHEWQYKSYTHNDRVYECAKCGKIEYR